MGRCAYSSTPLVGEDSHHSTQVADTLYTSMEIGGLVVLAFPCNQFANQEPGTNSEIYKFVTKKYQVDFPVFEKDRG